MNVIKKFLPLVLMAFMVNYQNAYAQDMQNLQKRKNKLYFGYAMLPLEVSGVSNIDMSDWENYGLWINNGGIEGRVRLPLSDGETSGLQSGIMLGYEYVPPNANFSLLAELQYAPGDSSVTSFFAGPKWNFYEQDRLSIGFAPKLGYIKASIDLGTASQIRHYGGFGTTYRAPVILDEGTIYDGDSISADLSGFGLQLALTSSYKLTDRWGINGQLGYSLSFLGDMEVVAGDITLDKNSRDLVKADGGNTQAGIDPEADASGIFFMLGLEWSF
jgi:hypothetical protein